MIRYKVIFNRVNRPGDGPHPVCIRVYHKYKSVFKSTGIKVLKKQWDPQKWIVNHPRAAEYNAIIRRLLHKLEEAELELARRDAPVSLDYITGRQRIDSRRSFVNYMEQAIESSSVRNSTKIQHKVTLAHVKSFGKIIGFGSLTYDTIVEFDQWLRNRGLSQHSIHSHHKRLKNYINKAIVAELMPVQNNPYLRFKPAIGAPVVRRYLTADELIAIESARLVIDRLCQVRDLFLFTCYTGLAYNELANL